MKYDYGDTVRIRQDKLEYVNQVIEGWLVNAPIFKYGEIYIVINCNEQKALVDIGNYENHWLNLEWLEPVERKS